MNLNAFNYELPSELIAYYPKDKRTDSRLLCLNCLSGEITHQHFYDLEKHLNPGDLLVFNNTQVIRARLFGKKETGGQIELLIERVLANQEVLAHVRASKALKVGGLIFLENNITLEMLGRENDLFRLRFLTDASVLDVLDKIGHIPLPPYIARLDEQLDESRYQTVYAKEKGSVAAPTAGLHFDEVLLKKLTKKGIEQAFVTLHVGAGTFQSVRVDDIEEHKMHSEWILVSQEVCDKVLQTKARGGRVIAVGTTSVRCLETASRGGIIQPYEGETDIFIYPGYHFLTIDGMITNFHLPQSTLLMLVSAFARMDAIKHAYQVAIAEKYRFFSYGDAMLII